MATGVLMRRRRGIAAAASALVLAVIAVHNVPDAVTEEDRDYGERILAAAGYTGAERDFGAFHAFDNLNAFDNQIRAIDAVQDAVISMAKLDEEITFDHAREPRDAFEQKKGLCYDRSRTIEKILGSLGFETRHVAVYGTDKRNALLALLTPGNDSHALTEVKTNRGWMAVDPNVRWIGLTAEGQPLTVAALRSIDMATARWSGNGEAAPHPIFRKRYTFVRGLYSRHGRFYPPYTPIPDVNWRQLVQNFID
jgi:hypothetical protein